MSLLIIAEHDHKILNPATLHTVTAAQQLENRVDILVLGDCCESSLRSKQPTSMGSVHCVIRWSNIKWPNSPSYIFQLTQEFASS